MASGPDDFLRVSFPASPAFGAVGRVAIAGLALRLGFDVAQVENLRLAIDGATTALAGTGSVTITARWNEQQLALELANPTSTMSAGDLADIEDALGALVPDVRVEPGSIELALSP